MPKLSRENRRKRRQDILDYIRENQPVSSARIRDVFGISRSSLSDDIRAINSQRLVIVQPKKGIYETIHAIQPEKNVYNPDSDDNVFMIRDFIDKDYIRKWIVLYTLSVNKNELTFHDLYDEIAEKRRFPCYPDTIRRDLNELAAEGFVEKRYEGNVCLFSSSFIYNPDRAEIRQFMERPGSSNPRIEMEAYDSIVQQLKHVCPDLETKHTPAASRVFAGKFNLFSDEHVGLLKKLDRLPYKDYALDLVYDTKANMVRRVLFYAGMIVYSVETGRLYLFGKDSDLRNIIIPIDRIDFEKTCVATVDGEKIVNVYFQTSEFMDIRRQMFNISVEDPQNVRVRFENAQFIRDRINNLARMRECSSVSVVNDDTEILYTDTVRGIYDFARYLRRFGGRAIVEEPEMLRNIMLETSRMTLALYDENETEKE